MSDSRCLLISCWTGPRRVQDPRAVLDPLFYLKLQFQQLQKIKHSLSHIMFVFSCDLLTDIEAIQDVNYNSPNLGCNHEFIYRHNHGLSYGAWSDGFIAKPDYDYYFFLEDDYCFTYDHWDDKIVKIIRGSHDAFICGYSENPPTGKYPVHADISIGGCSGSILRRIYREYGTLPHADSADYLECEEKGQVAFSRAFPSLRSLHRDWQIPYVGADSSIKWFGPPNGRALWLPAQCLDLEEKR